MTDKPKRLIPNDQITSGRGHGDYPAEAEEHARAYPEDVARLVRACREAGYEISPVDAAAAFGEWSEDTYAAGWYLLDGTDAALAAIVLGRCRVTGGES